MRKLMSILALSLLANSAQAVVSTGLIPSLVGLQGDGATVYIGLTNTPAPCTFGGIYFIAGTIAERKAVLATALAAKLAGRTLRIDYVTGGAGGVCLLSGLFIE